MGDGPWICSARRNSAKSCWRQRPMSSKPRADRPLRLPPDDLDQPSIVRQRRPDLKWSSAILMACLNASRRDAPPTLILIWENVSQFDSQHSAKGLTGRERCRARLSGEIQIVVSGGRLWFIHQDDLVAAMQVIL